MPESSGVAAPGWVMVKLGLAARGADASLWPAWASLPVVLCVVGVSQLLGSFSAVSCEWKSMLLLLGLVAKLGKTRQWAKSLTIKSLTIPDEEDLKRETGFALEKKGGGDSE